MRLCVLGLALTLITGPARAENEKVKPISPAEAAKKVNQTVTVEMQVKNVGKATSGKVFYLNSSADFKAKDNFTVVLFEKTVEAFKKDGVKDVTAHFKG